ncbi:hypothetical protein JHK85_018762 [Glycine max]|nr:hypothetical protein JHK85_018762 [Glycine max]
MEGSNTIVPSIVVYVIVPNKEAGPMIAEFGCLGKKLTGSIVKEKLAACVNRVPGENFSLPNFIQTDSEELLIIKTRQSLLEALIEHRIKLSKIWEKMLEQLNSVNETKLGASKIRAWVRKNEEEKRWRLGEDGKEKRKRNMREREGFERKQIKENEKENLKEIKNGRSSITNGCWCSTVTTMRQSITRTKEKDGE